MRQHFVICVHQAPVGSQSAYHALRFAQAVIELGHEIDQVFFYQDAVQHANAFLSIPSDELNLADAWRALSDVQKIPLICCVGAGTRRGVVGDDMHHAEQDSTYNLAQGFRLAGLAEWVQAVESADKVIQF